MGSIASITSIAALPRTELLHTCVPVSHSLDICPGQEFPCWLMWSCCTAKTTAHWCTCLVTRLYPTLSDSLDCSPAGSSVHEIFQARIPEWVAISFSRDLPNPGIESASPVSPALQMDSLPTEPLGESLTGILTRLTVVPAAGRELQLSPQVSRTVTVAVRKVGYLSRAECRVPSRQQEVCNIFIFSLCLLAQLL